MQINRHSHTEIITQGSTTYMRIEEGFASLESRMETIELGRRLAVSDCHSSPPENLLCQKPSCRCIHVVRKRRTASKRFSISRNMFGFKVSASFEVDMGSLYALKLTPSLDFRAVVPYDAPAFELIDRIREMDFNFQPELMPDLVNTTIVELRQLYSEGKARPSDMNPNGEIILHVRF